MAKRPLWRLLPTAGPTDDGALTATLQPRRPYV